MYSEKKKGNHCCSAVYKVVGSMEMEINLGLSSCVV